MTQTEERVSTGIEVNVQKVEGRPGIAVLDCKGYVDTYNSADFSRAVKAVIDGGVKNIIFDMEKINYVSSTGVGTFAAFLKLLKPIGGNFVIAGLQPRVFEVFQLLGFSKFFNMAEDAADGLEFFPVQNGGKPVPFKVMYSITNACGRLERFVARENQSEFYAELLEFVKAVEELKKA